MRLERKPLYAQASERIWQMIREGTFQPGDRLPSESDLAHQLGISRATLREALRFLADQGVIIRRQGVGTFVSPNRHLESGLERLESVLTLAARQGMKTSVQNLTVESAEPDQVVAQRLGLADPAPLTRISRTILVEGRPVAHMTDLVLARLLSPGDLDESFDGSVLDLLRQQYDILQALTHITATRAGRFLARQLDVSPSAPLLLLEETLFDTAHSPIGFSRNYFVPDRFRFYLFRR